MFGITTKVNFFRHASLYLQLLLLSVGDSRILIQIIFRVKILDIINFSQKMISMGIREYSTLSAKVDWRDANSLIYIGCYTKHWLCLLQFRVACVVIQRTTRRLK